MAESCQSFPDPIDFDDPAYRTEVAHHLIKAVALLTMTSKTFKARLSGKVTNIRVAY